MLRFVSRKSGPSEFHSSQGRNGCRSCGGGIYLCFHSHRRLVTDRTYPIPAQQHIKRVAVYSDSKASSLCLASKPALGGRPPFCGASRRFIVPSRACTNSALPRGRPVWVHRRISVSLDSISPAARYCRQALAVQLFRHSSKSNISLRASAPQCAAALDHIHASASLAKPARTGFNSV